MFEQVTPLSLLGAVLRQQLWAASWYEGSHSNA